MKPSKYTFAAYAPQWSHEFAREAARLQSLLGDALLTVHHIGSTSVPGLPAKPTIDLLPVVWDISMLDESTALRVNAGYTVWGEYGLPGRRFFTKDREQFRTHNLHFYQEGHTDIERHLAFCAYLRHHDDIRDGYAELKRAIYARHPEDIQAYNDGKDEWIKRVELLAIAWFRRQGTKDQW